MSFVYQIVLSCRVEIPGVRNRDSLDPATRRQRLALPFPTIRKMEGDAMDVLYVSTIQGSYLCTQTAAS